MQFIRGDLKPRSYSGKWRSDKVLQTVNSEGNLVLWDVETDDKTTIELEISTQDHDWTVSSCWRRPEHALKNLCSRSS